MKSVDLSRIPPDKRSEAWQRLQTEYPAQAAWVQDPLVQELKRAFDGDLVLILPEQGDQPMTADGTTDKELSDMALPDGMTCSACAHHHYCRGLFGVKGPEITCDFAPSRFQPASKES